MALYLNNITTISNYYIKDNRLFELYISLLYCQHCINTGVTKINRNEAEKILKKLNTPNNNNWKNAFIALSSLGLIDSNNIPTYIGSLYASNSYENFCLDLYKSYIKNYIDLIMDILLDVSNNEINIDFNCQINTISNKIKDIYNKDVLYITESKNRYLSSWLNIMRDDYMCLKFDSRNNKRKILYNIYAYNDEAIKKTIKNNEYAFSFINKFKNIIKMDN